MISRPFARTIALALVALTGCGAALDEASPDALGSRSDAVIHGEACAPTREPATVALVLDAVVDFGPNDRERILTYLCSGALIAPDTVITAAHCLEPDLVFAGEGKVVHADYYVSFEADLHAIALGDATELPDDALHVKAYQHHESFSPTSTGGSRSGPARANDVGLAFLDAPVAGVTPAIVITYEEAAGAIAQGAPVTIAGWGFSAPPLADGSPPEGATGLRMCGTTTINEVGDTEMQIGGGAATTRKCEGDSGGPTYAEVTTATTPKERLVGITSRSYDPGDPCTKGGLDTRVDAYRDWLDAQMREGCANGTRTWCTVEGLVPPEFYAPAPPAPVGTGAGAGGDAKSGCQSVSISAAAMLGLVASLRRRRS